MKYLLVIVIIASLLLVGCDEILTPEETPIPSETATRLMPTPPETTEVLTPTPEPTVDDNTFCGTSTYGECDNDSEVMTNGCSGQICQSIREEGISTSCEWLDCYDAEKHNMECKCIDGLSQWSEIEDIPTPLATETPASTPTPISTPTKTADSEAKCPECGNLGVPVIYGLPTPEDTTRVERKEIFLGGCVVDDDAPKYYCFECGAKWGQNDIVMPLTVTE